MRSSLLSGFAFLAFPILAVTSINAAFGGIDEGLVASFPFSGNANDASGQNNHGIVHGAILTADRFGNPDGAYAFNGGSYIEVPDSTSLELTQDLSLSFWIKSNDQSQQKIIIAKHISGDANLGSWAMIYHAPDGKASFQASPYFDPNTSTASPVMAGSWHHVAFTYTRQSTAWRMYLDGILDNSGMRSYDIRDTPRPLLIGAQEHPAGLQAFFNGSLDDIRIYARSLSESDILQLYEEDGSPQKGPDLAVHTFSYIDKGLITPGESVKAILVAKNIGTVASQSCQYQVLALNSIGDTMLSVTGNLPALGGGGEVTKTASLSFPASLPEGSYIIRMIVDPTSAVADTNRLNNQHDFHTQVERPGKLYALCLAQYDNKGFDGLENAKAVQSILKSQFNWASEAEGNLQTVFWFPYDGSAIKEQLKTLVDALGSKILPEDVFIFYYNGHGGQHAWPNCTPELCGDGGETSVQYRTLQQRVIRGDYVEIAEPSANDEFFGDISDDELTEMFLHNGNWDDVDKVFIFDCCHAGGFAGTSATDSGDLDKLPKYILIAAAKEEELTIAKGYFLAPARGVWTESVLLPAMKDRTLGRSNLNDLVANINGRMPAFRDAIRGEVAMVEEEPGIVASIEPPTGDVLRSQDLDMYRRLLSDGTEWLRIQKISETDKIVLSWPSALPGNVEASQNLLLWAPIVPDRNEEGSYEKEFKFHEVPVQYFRLRPSTSP